MEGALLKGIDSMRIGRLLSPSLVMSCSVLSTFALTSAQALAVDRSPTPIAPFSASALNEQDSGRGEQADNPTLSELSVNLRNFLNGEVTLRLQPIGSTAQDVTVTFSQSSYTVDSQSVFSLVDGSFTFEFPDQEQQVLVPPGDYQLVVENNLEPAVADLPVGCEILSSDTLSISVGAAVQLDAVELFCGTPTQQLTPTRLQELRASPENQRLPAVIDANLFSICLGNGGSNFIYNEQLSFNDLGDGVAYVENLLELTALQESMGAGLNISCNALSDGTFAPGVVDIPMWSYLVQLDLLSRIGLQGNGAITGRTEGDISDGAGSYTDAEVLGLIAPYNELFTADANTIGVLGDTPTLRLTLLDLARNPVGSMRWTDLWRISANPLYRVGDFQTLNDGTFLFSHAITIDVDQDVADIVALQNEPGSVQYTQFDGPVGGTQISWPLDQSSSLTMVFGPFVALDFGSSGLGSSSISTTISVTGLPEGVGCLSPGFNISSEGVFFEASFFTPYPASNPSPLVIRCIAETNRVTGRFDLEPVLFDFEFESIQIELLDVGGSVVQEQLIPARREITSAIDFVFSNVPPGEYTIRIDDESVNPIFCDAASLSFAVGEDDFVLPTVSCTSN